jgi:hypothetical protein
MTGPPATGPGPGRSCLAGLDLPTSREIITGCLAVINGPAPVTGQPGSELHQHAKAGPQADNHIPGSDSRSRPRQLLTATSTRTRTADLAQVGAARRG